MTLERFRAVVLQRHETQNTSEMIHLVSDRFGPLSLWAKGIQRKSSSHQNSLLQPLYLVEIQATLRPESDVATLRDVDVLQDAVELQRNLTSFSTACLVAELVACSAVNGQPMEQEFSLLLSLFDQLRTPEWKAEPAPFIWEFCQLLGCFGYLPLFSERLSQPWPAGQPKPTHFTLNLQTGLLDLPSEYSSTQPILWPVVPLEQATTCLLPPCAVRCLYVLDQGMQENQIAPVLPPITLSEARQIILGLSLFLEHHMDVRLKSLPFFVGLFQPPSATK